MLTPEYSFHNVRSSAVLTTSYVAGTLIKGPLGVGCQDYTQLELYVTFTKASTTSAEIRVDYANHLIYALAYDGQTANFTAGKVVTGTRSGATGYIVSDTDAGTTGTLYISGANGTFFDNEAITDNNSTPGVAVVNGALVIATAAPDDTSFFQDSNESVSAGTTTVRENIWTIVSANQSAATQKYRLRVPVNDRWIRVSAKCTGTEASSALAIDAILSTN
jgi:hypothetical protein